MNDRNLNPYLYRNTQGAYPQYHNLTSGVGLLVDNKIPLGINDMVKSFQDIEAAKIQDEKEKQAKFNDLVQTSLKDVHGQWRDEAVKKRDDFLSKATRIASESQGNLTWDQQKELQNEKDALEEFAGKSKAVNDWYTKAVAHTAGIKDVESRRQTAENIKRIMAGKTLDDVYKGTLDPNWVATPNYTMYEVLDSVPAKYKVSGTTSSLDEDATKETVKNAYLTNDSKMLWMKDQFDRIHPDKAGDDNAFYDYVVQAKKAMSNNLPANKLRYFSTRKGKGDTRAVAAYADGVYDFNDVDKGNGIKLNSIIGTDGKTYKDVHIIGQFKKDGKDYVRVVHAAPDMTEKEKQAKILELGTTKFKEEYNREPTKDDMKDVKSLGEHQWQASILMFGAKEPNKTKSSVKWGVEEVPLTKILDQQIGKKVIREGYNPSYTNSKENSVGGEDDIDATLKELEKMYHK